MACRRWSLFDFVVNFVFIFFFHFVVFFILNFVMNLVLNFVVNLVLNFILNLVFDFFFYLCFEFSFKDRQTYKSYLPSLQSSQDVNKKGPTWKLWLDNFWQPIQCRFLKCPWFFNQCNARKSYCKISVRRERNYWGTMRFHLRLISQLALVYAQGHELCSNCKI